MAGKSGWQLDDRAVAAFEKYTLPAFGLTWARDMLGRARPEPGDRVLDLACGLGALTRLAAAAAGPTGMVAGVDINPAMLDRAKSMAAPPGAAIEWHRADGADLPFEAGSFELAFCHHGLQFFPDRAAALAEVFRVLATGGRLAVSVWRPLEFSPLFQAVHDAFQQWNLPLAAKILASAYSLADEQTAKELVERAGFRDVSRVVVIRQMRFGDVDEFLSQGLAAGPYFEALATLSSAQRQQFLAGIKTAISGYIDDKGLAAPMEAQVITATK